MMCGVGETGKRGAAVQLAVDSQPEARQGSEGGRHLERLPHCIVSALSNFQAAQNTVEW